MVHDFTPHVAIQYAGKGRVNMFVFSLIFGFTYPPFVVPCHLSDF